MSAHIRRQFLKALRAIAEGYPVRGEDDRYIIVENPDYKPDDGSDPNLLIDLHNLPEILE